MWDKLWKQADSEDFNQSAHRWFQFALIAATVTGLFFACAGVVVINQSSAENSQKVAQAFAPFFIGAMAAVTFCGAVWRGKITSEQSRQQQRQNDAKDDENLAKLLQEGAKLLAPGEKNSNMLAGVSSLALLLTDKNQRFSTQAMDILADFAIYAFNQNGLDRAFRATNRALYQGQKAGLSATFGHEFERAKEELPGWPAMFGLLWISYQGGTVFPPTFEQFADLENLRGFDAVYFFRCKINDRYGFNRCIFEDCTIEVFCGDDLYRNQFLNCDFSGAAISANSRRDGYTLGINSAHNFFFQDQPIICSETVDWEGILERKPTGDAG